MVKGQAAAQTPSGFLTFLQAKGTIVRGQTTPVHFEEAVVPAQILIVDNDEAFATILKEGIEMSGELLAIVATSTADARDSLAKRAFAMAIVDLGLEEDDPVALLQDLREQQPEIRLMVIPFDEVPNEVNTLGIQGTLSKPFFLPDIPAQIEGALARPLGALPSEAQPDDIAVETILNMAPTELIPAVAEAAASAEPVVPTVIPPELLAHLANESQRISDHLRFLSRELNADAVLLTYGAELVAYAGHFGRADAERLAQVVCESWRASARVAAALGREQVRFEQSLHEGEDYLLYSLATSADIVLSVALRSDRPLGMIRYNTKQTAQELQPILLPR
jgi:ActR/RegA family two-component response regulator/predicted regulator of Ras-like GTPase activity (Roadblock/LC7/MglB family)